MSADGTGGNGFAKELLQQAILEVRDAQKELSRQVQSTALSVAELHGEIKGHLARSTDRIESLERCSDKHEDRIQELEALRPGYLARTDRIEKLEKNSEKHESRLQELEASRAEVKGKSRFTELITTEVFKWLLAIGASAAVAAIISAAGR